jgi:hypothetical protein
LTDFQTENKQKEEKRKQQNNCVEACPCRNFNNFTGKLIDFDKYHVYLDKFPPALLHQRNHVSNIDKKFNRTCNGQWK